jgi:hypothetical protein
MNKYFALSLLMLSWTVAYGMEGGKASCTFNADCCKSSAPHCTNEQTGHDSSELKKYEVDVDVKINLSEQFKARLVEGSQTNFTVNLKSKEEAAGHPIVGLYLNEKRKVEVYAGKGTVGESQHWVTLTADRNHNKTTNGINIRLTKELASRLINHADVVEKCCNWNQKVELNIGPVGRELNIYDRDFSADNVEVSVTARPVGEGVPLTQAEIDKKRSEELDPLVNYSFSLTQAEIDKLDALVHYDRPISPSYTENEDDIKFYQVRFNQERGEIEKVEVSDQEAAAGIISNNGHPSEFESVSE